MNNFEEYQEMVNVTPIPLPIRVIYPDLVSYSSPVKTSWVN